MASGLTVERAIVVDDQMRTVDDADVYAVGECAQHRGEVYGLVAPLWEQAVVLADHITGADRGAAYHGSRTATKLKVMGVDVASMGCRSRSGTPTRTSCSPSPRRGVYKKLVIRDGKLVGAILLGDTSEGRLPDAGVRPRHCRCPRSGWSCCSTSAARRAEVGVAELPTTPRSATATASARPRSCAPSTAAAGPSRR